MPRYLMFCLLVIWSGCQHTVFPPDSSYQAWLSYPDSKYRLILRLADDPTVFVVGFRPNEIPLDTFYYQDDSLVFSRADFFSRFEGKYNKGDASISGRWIDEDRKSWPLTFVPVNTDTIPGFKPKNTTNYQYSVPAGDEDGISNCALTEVEVSQEKILELVKAIRSEEFGFQHSLLISRNNCVAFEDYFYNFHRDVTFGIQSVTKSFVSALTGIALERNELQKLGDPLCVYLPEYKSHVCNEQNRSITLEDVLTMNTGLDWNETGYDYGDERNSLVQSGGGNAFEFLFTRSRLSKRFAYNSMNHAVMNMVLKTSTGLENADEMRSRLMEPLNISTYDLGTPDQYGLIGDIFMRPRDMLKFGLLYLNDGQYNNRQVVPAAWISASTTGRVVAGDNLGYGYFWWTTSFQWQDKIVHSYFAWGYGGQYIFVVPELELVVVMNGTNWSTDPTRYAFEMMQRYIIPACD